MWWKIKHIFQKVGTISGNGQSTCCLFCVYRYLVYVYYVFVIKLIKIILFIVERSGAFSGMFDDKSNYWLWSSVLFQRAGKIFSSILFCFVSIIGRLSKPLWTPYNAGTSNQELKLIKLLSKYLILMWLVLLITSVYF